MSPEEFFQVRVRVEGLQVRLAFACTEPPNGDPELATDSDGGATPGRTVVLGQHDAALGHQAARRVDPVDVVERALAAGEDHLAAAQGLAEGRRQGCAVGNPGGRPGQAPAVLVAHGDRLDLDHPVRIDQLCHLHQRAGRKGWVKELYSLIPPWVSLAGSSNCTNSASVKSVISAATSITERPSA